MALCRGSAAVVIDPEATPTPGLDWRKLMSSELRRRFTATTVIFAVLAFVVVSPTWADNAVFTGKVLESDPPAPKADVVITLVDPASEQTFSSQKTGTDGLFRVDNAPAGSYRVVAETPEGAYLAADAVDLSAGQNRPVSLTLSGAAPNYQSTAGAGGQQAQGGGLPTWAKWVIVGGIVVIGAAAVASVTDDDDETPASP
jgi:hypothetical protein